MGVFDKLKSTVTSSAKKAATNKAREAVGLEPTQGSDGVADTAKKAAAERAKKTLIAAGKKFFAFIIGSPIGWLTGLLLITIMSSIGKGALKDVDASKLVGQNEVSTADVYQGSGQGAGQEGQDSPEEDAKKLLVVDSCPPDTTGSNASTDGKTSSGGLDNTGDNCL